LAIKTSRILRSKFGVFYFRFIEDGRQRKMSLHTKNPIEARLLALQLNHHFERAKLMGKLFHAYEIDLASGTVKANDLDDHRLAMEALKQLKTTNKAIARSNPPLSTKPLPSGTTLYPAIEAYLKIKRHDNTERTLKEKRSCLGEFHDAYGSRDLHYYTPAIIRKWVEKEDSKGSLSATSINKRLSFISDFFDYLIAKGYYSLGANPCQNQRISTKKKLADKAGTYLPLENEELRKIFGQGYAAFMNKAHHYWIPILGLYLGARIEELASLTVENVRVIDGIACISIIKGKNKNAIRHIPIHSKVINLGFLDYVEKIRGKGKAQVFPLLNGGEKGFSKNTSRRFGELLDKVGITDRLKVFHSLRHTFITRLHEASAPATHVMRLAGHTPSAFAGVHMTNYVHFEKISTAALSSTLELLKYPEDLQIEKPIYKV
jgi:integrase